jgi:hypothetical protein
MSCERFREALSRHAAGDGIDAAAAAHLADCRACVARLELQRQLLSDVDAELERALAIDASPELVERVVSGSRVASGSFWGGRAAWVGLAAAALAAAVYLRAPADGPLMVPSQPSPVTTRAGVATGPSSASTVPVTPGSPNARGLQTRVTPVTPHLARRRPSVAASAVPGARARMHEPPVIVEPARAVAIARLRELLRQGRITEQMLPPVRPHEPTELSVTPLRIPDIAVPDVDSAGHTDAGARQRQ